MPDLTELRQRLEAAAKDPIPMSSIIRKAGGIKEIKALNPTNAISELQKNARAVQKEHQEDAEPQTVDTKLIKDWVDTNL